VQLIRRDLAALYLFIKGFEKCGVLSVPSAQRGLMIAVKHTPTHGKTGRFPANRILPEQMQRCRAANIQDQTSGCKTARKQNVRLFIVLFCAGQDEPEENGSQKDDRQRPYKV